MNLLTGFPSLKAITVGREDTYNGKMLEVWIRSWSEEETNVVLLREFSLGVGIHRDEVQGLSTA